MNLSDEEIGKKIKQYRKGKMTQRELAEKIGKTESSIRKYEKGLVTIPLDVLEQIASSLGITAFDLMGGGYFVRKYPEIAKESKEIEGFVDYLNSLGYVVNDICEDVQIPVEELKKSGQMDVIVEEYEETGFVPAEAHAIELVKDGQNIILEDDEFFAIFKDTRDIISFKLWQKSQENKSM